MLFNQYIWNLYKNSGEYKKHRKFFKQLRTGSVLHDIYRLPLNLLSSLYNDNIFSEIHIWNPLVWLNTEIMKKVKVFIPQNKVQKIKAIKDIKLRQEKTIKLLRTIFKNINDNCKTNTELWKYIEDINAITLYLYRLGLDVIPYNFSWSYIVLEEIHKSFNITLLEPPGKNQVKKVLSFYVDLLEKSWYPFMNNLDFDIIDMCTFLYGFALNFSDAYSIGYGDKKNTNVLNVKHANAWITVASKKEDKEDLEDLMHVDGCTKWSCHEETSQGDVIFIYQTAPQSAITYVARALSHGFRDPFARYKSVVVIGNFKRIPPITIKEMRSNKVLSHSPVVKRDFQGIKGDPITDNEYCELLHILESKGYNIQDLPKPITSYVQNANIQLEKDVANKLVDPLLEKLDIKHGDIKKEFNVPMGRGESYWADYAIEFKVGKTFISAKFIIETKKSIRNRKELMKAFIQASSYAIRLNSVGFAIISEEGIWIWWFEKFGYKFDENKFEKYGWNILGDRRNLKKIKVKFKKYRII